MFQKRNQPDPKRQPADKLEMGPDTPGVVDEKRHFGAPPTAPVKPTPEGEKHDHMAEREAQAEDRQEALLDEAIEETFPGSDPISPKHIT